MMPESTHPERVRIDLPPNAWHGHATETVWADRTAHDSFRLRSIPLFVNGVSVGDVVAVRWDAGQAVLDHVILRGGHSTYRIFLLKVGLTSEAFTSRWYPLEKIGCRYERGTTHLLAVDVPSYADIQLVYALLQKGEDDKVWEFEEGHCGHTLG